MPCAFSRTRRVSYDRATGLYRESVAVGRDLWDLRLMAISLYNLGEVARYEGDDTRATSLLGGLAPLPSDRVEGGDRHVRGERGRVLARAGPAHASGAPLRRCRRGHGNAPLTPYTVPNVRFNPLAPWKEVRV